MYTYQFNYDETIDEFGKIQFCAENKKEAKILFKDWQTENGYNIKYYTTKIVYNEDDAKAYGSRYMK